MLLYQALRLLLKPLMWLLFSIKVEGKENIPATGGAVLAANHGRLCDAGVIGFVCSRPITFGAKSEFFRRKGIGWLTKPLFTALRQMSVDRSGGSGARAFVDAAINHVGTQELLGIFPEGYLSPPGQLHKMRRGAAYIATGARVPVVLIAIKYGTRSWRTLGRQRITVTVAPSVVFGSEDPHTAALRIDEGLQKLTGYSTTGVYARRDTQ